MEDRLSIDVSEALAAVARVDAALADVATNFQSALDAAVSSVGTVESTLDLSADTAAITSDVDAAIAAADDIVPVEADTTGVTGAVDAALAAADTNLEVDADVTAAREAINSLSGDTVEVDVQAVGAEDTSAAFDNVASSAHAAGDASGHAAEQFAIAGVAAKAAAGESGALSEGFHLLGSSGATAAAGIAAVAVVGHELISNALDARSAQERFNLVLGDSAEAVARINLGGLNTDLTELGLRLGTTGPSMENAAAKIFSLGTNSGKAAPEVAATTKEIISLAARAVALNPALGDVGAVAERALGGLARGGRFAANLGLSLTAADISARALADTGKAVAADLTLYEKAAAGAELATERLGTSLSTDINSGAENIKTQFASVKARFEEALETLGQPLLDPLLEATTKIMPTLADLAGAFAKLIEPALEVAAAFADSLGPALEVAAPLLDVIAAALGAVADVLGIIPGPLKTAAVLVLALSLAFDKLAASAAARSITAIGEAGFAGSLAKLGAILNPVTLAIAGSAAGIIAVQNATKSTDKAVNDYLQSWVKVLGQQTTIQAYEEQIAGVTDAANQYGEAANKLNNPEGRLFHSGELRSATEARIGLDSIRTSALSVVETAKELQTQFHLTDAAALALAAGGEEAVKAFEAQAEAADHVTAAMTPAQHATDEFWLAATSGAASATDIANQAQAAGVSFDDMATAVQKAREPVVKFAQDIEDALPGAAKALDDLGDNDGLTKFLKNQEQNLADSAAFVSNIQQLIDRGATALAGTFATLASQDPEKAAKLAAAAVKETTAALSADNLRQQNADVGRGLVDLAAQNIADELRGGKIELEFAKTQDAIGAAMLKIPGQVEPDARQSGEEIAGILVDGVLGGAGLGTLPQQAFGIGKDTAVGLSAGMQGNESEVVFASVQLAKTVTDAFRQTLGTHSPSTVFIEIGQDVAAGFFQGLADIAGAEKATKPLLDVVNKFHLNAADIANAAGSSIDEITNSLTKLGEAQDAAKSKKLTADDLLDVGAAVKALGGSKGVKELQAAIAQQVSAAFGGATTKEIEAIVSGLNTRAAVGRLTDIVGVTPTVPEPFKTNVVKGADNTTPLVGGDLVVNVQPPPDASASEIAGDVAVAAAWALNGVAP